MKRSHVALIMGLVAAPSVLYAQEPVAGPVPPAADDPCPIRQTLEELGARLETRLAELGRRAHQTLTHLGERAEVAARRWEDRLGSLPRIGPRREERAPRPVPPGEEQSDPLVVKPRRTEPQGASDSRPPSGQPGLQAPRLSGPSVVATPSKAPDWVNADRLGAFQGRGFAPTSELAEQRAREALERTLAEKLAALVQQDAALRDYAQADREVALQETAEVLAASAQVKQRHQNDRGEQAVLLDREALTDAHMRAEFTRRLGTARPQPAIPQAPPRPKGDDF